MRRIGHRISACAGVLWLLACGPASDPPAMSAGAQSTAQVAGSAASSAAAGSVAPAADSGGRGGAGPTKAAPTMSAGTTAAPSSTAAGAGAGGTPSAGAGSAAMASGGAGAAAAGTPAAVGGMGGAAGAGATAGAFILTPVGFPMAGNELTFPETANPPTNQSPEFTWTGVPAETKSLALAFRDLGNSAVKWIIWDMPPSLMHIPPDIMPVAMPSEVPGSSQLGSLDNQGYAGPGSGARQYDFTLWALDTDKLPVTARMTTVQIHELLEMHEVEKTPPVLVRNTRNL